MQGVHIADTAKILDADMACYGLFILIEANVPVAFFICAPRWIQIEPFHIDQDHRKILNAVRAERLQELE